MKNDEIFHVSAGLQATTWTSNILFICPMQAKKCQNHEQMIKLSELEQVFYKKFGHASLNRSLVDLLHVFMLGRSCRVPTEPF